MMTIRQKNDETQLDHVIEATSIRRNDEKPYLLMYEGARGTESLDLRAGDVFVMNERGATVATFRAPVVVSTADDGNQTSDDLAGLNPGPDIASGPFPVY